MPTKTKVRPEPTIIEVKEPQRLLMLRFKVGELPSNIPLVDGGGNKLSSGEGEKEPGEQFIFNQQHVGVYKLLLQLHNNGWGIADWHGKRLGEDRQYATFVFKRDPEAEAPEGADDYLISITFNVSWNFCGKGHRNPNGLTSIEFAGLMKGQQPKQILSLVPAKDESKEEEEALSENNEG